MTFAETRDAIDREIRDHEQAIERLRRKLLALCVSLWVSFGPFRQRADGSCEQCGQPWGWHELELRDGNCWECGEPWSSHLEPDSTDQPAARL